MAAGDEEDFGSARITIDLDDADAVADARDLGLRIRRALDRATRDVGDAIRRNIERGLAAVTVSVDVAPDLGRFDDAVRAHRAPPLTVDLLPDLEALNRTVRGHKLPQLPVDLVPDLDALSRAVRGHKLPALNVDLTPDIGTFMARLRALLAGERVRIRVIPDLTGFDDAIRAHRPPDVTVNVNPDVDSSRFSRAMSGLASIAGGVGRALSGLLAFGAVGIAAAAAAQGVLVLGAALAPMVGILAALPAAVAVAGAAFGALQLALSGVKESFTAALTGTSEEFTKSLEKLSPKAQAAAREVRALKPAFDNLKRSVQDAFFGQIEGQITKTSTALKGPLSAGLKGVSKQWGRVASESLKALASQRGVSAVTSVFDAAEAAVGGLADSTRGVTDGLLAIVDSVSDAFGKKLGGAIGGVGERLGTFLTKAADSGQAVRWVSAAVAAFKDLGGIVVNVGSILKSVFSVADEAGGGLLQNLRNLTGSLREFLNTDAGESALTGIFSTVGEIASQLGPILAELVTQLGKLAPAIAPVFSEIGPAIQELLSAVGPLLTEFAPSLEIVAAALGDTFAGLDFSGLGSAVGQVVEALAPLLPLAGEVANSLAEVLGPVLENLARLFGPIIEQVAGALIPVLPELSASLARVAEALKPVVSALGEGLGDAIKELLPPLLEQLPKLVDELLPAFEKLADVLTPLIPKLIQLAVKAIKPLIPLLPKFVSYVSKLVDIFTAMLEKGVEVVQFFRELDESIKSFGDAAEDVGKRIGEFVTSVLDYFRDLYNELVGNSIVPDLINGIVDWFTQLPGRVLDTLTGFVDSVVLYFSELPGKIAEQLTTLGTSLTTTLETGFTQGVDAVVRFVGQVVDYLTGLPGRAVESLATYGSLLYERLVSGGTTAYNAVVEFAVKVINYLRGLPGRAGEALASLGSRLADRARAAGASLLAEITSFVGRAIEYVRGLPGRAASALSGIRSALVRAGADMIGGFISGVRSRAADLVSAARKVISGAIDAADDVLDFGSPSKVFIKLGKDTGAGFAIGLSGTASQIQAAARRVTEGVIKIGREIGIGFITSLTGTAAQIKSTTTKLANDIAAAFKGVKTTVDDRLIALVQTSNVRLQKLAVQRDAIAKRLEEAQKFAGDLAKSTLSNFSLQNLIQGDDGASTTSVVRGLKAAIFQVKAFTKQVDTLAQRGLNKSLLEQVLGLGPEKGAEIATALSQADKATLARINDLQKQLVTASDKLGRTGADALYDSGKAAGEGFLAGIKGQQKAIEKLMIDIAKGMQRAIRKALDIRSPSHVFHRIGEMTGAGLHGGLLSRMAALQVAARTAARGVVSAVASEFSGMPGLAGSLPSDTVIPLTRAQRAQQRGQETAAARRPAAGGRGTGGQAAASGATVSNTFHISEVGNARATAHRVANRLALAGSGL